eukprot:g5181.t1
MSSESVARNYLNKAGRWAKPFVFVFAESPHRSLNKLERLIQHYPTSISDNPTDPVTGDNVMLAILKNIYRNLPCTFYQRLYESGGNISCLSAADAILISRGECNVEDLDILKMIKNVKGYNRDDWRKTNKVGDTIFDFIRNCLVTTMNGFEESGYEFMNMLSRLFSIGHSVKVFDFKPYAIAEKQPADPSSSTKAEASEALAEKKALKIAKARGRQKKDKEQKNNRKKSRAHKARR